ncbi:ABC transporter ATP-binding protein [Pseudooctadecabacter jejudonensis]|uniref:ABC transporter ATP-binding protein YtrE n=1 Tax=Pseudooctadecabacter jejudonensis TaxID=1391910 RepID=A0A1Y5SJT4_9RHOB|nr:ABC transporter ATP-binding protein [Pseudooctadecabacter jejudonensis]SLN40743.1 ABC transporter ATP-binding protein YtrE [Pseudooctadecabacter jejudonensis]
MVRVEDLRFGYGATGFRLHVPEFTLAARERVAIVGPSGSGKTTLLNLIAGILTPEAGRIDVAGTDVSQLSDAERRKFRASQIGFVFQDFALLDYLPARQNILYPYRITPALTLDQDARDRAEALAVACGIGDKLDRHPNALSQGEQQRVAICRALVTQPNLILSDEATGNLDPDSKARILDLLFEQAAEAGASVLAVTHDHELLPRFERVLDFAQFRVAAVDEGAPL